METPAGAGKPLRVGLVIGSQRVVRVGPQIAMFVHDTIQAHQNSSSSSLSSSARPVVEIDVIDIASLHLPLDDEATIPSQVTDRPDGYDHAQTRAWSARAEALDGFVVVSPQYNWGIPAGLKNALDHLYHEWAGKPVAVVTYGGHGGGKCAEALRVVLGGGLRMRVVEPGVELAFPDRGVLARAAAGQALGLDARDEGGLWAEKRAEIVKVWEELLKAL